MEKKIKALVIDDSSLMRQKIRKILESDHEIEVVGQGENGLDGVNKIKELQPDVITLDIDMPLMDGLTAIKHIMIENPTPIVVLSSMTDNGAVTFNVLRLGAADFVAKPSGAISKDLELYREHIVERVKIAASFSLEDIKRVKVNARGINKNTETMREDNWSPKFLITIGASVGEHNSAIRILSRLPKNLPVACLVMLDVTPKIIPSFVNELNQFCGMSVQEIKEGIALKKGTCCIASINHDISFYRNVNDSVFIKLSEPSENPIDKMFSQAGKTFHHNVVGVLLTHTYHDGMTGLEKIKASHGTTIIRDISNTFRHHLHKNPIDSSIVDFCVNDSDLAEKICELINIS